MRFTLVLAFSLSCAFTAGWLFTNIVLGCETYDRELWTAEHRCLLPSDVLSVASN
jgi:hypothetical protein